MQPLRNRHDYGENPPPTEPILSKVANRMVVGNMAEKIERQHFLEVAKQIQNVSVAFGRLVGCVTSEEEEAAEKAVREMTNEISILMQRATFLSDEVYDATREGEDYCFGCE